MPNRTAALMLTLFTAAGTASAVLCPPPDIAQPDVQVADVAKERPVVEVVFVLDTTGSMSGLIEGAKQTIWSIATEIARAEPTPIVKMGLVGYRDRTDAYVVQSFELTEDLDAMYTSLMGFEAAGGGDTPESVNEALHTAVTGFDWSADGTSLRLVYLVGDAPPHMDYQDDVPYLDSCALALERGLIVNAIQCGSASDTEEIWREIAAHAEGRYERISQSGGVAVIETPFDDELASLGAELGATALAYGVLESQRAQAVRQESSIELGTAMSAAPAADRATYNVSKAGARNAYGEQDLIRDLDAGTVTLDTLPEAELPEAMQAMTPEERDAHIEGLRARRAAIQSRIAELSEQRARFQREKMAERPSSGFDARVIEALREQAATKGLSISDDATEPDNANDTSDESES